MRERGVWGARAKVRTTRQDHGGTVPRSKQFPQRQVCIARGNAKGLGSTAPQRSRLGSRLRSRSRSILSWLVLCSRLACGDAGIFLVTHMARQLPQGSPTSSSLDLAIHHTDPNNCPHLMSSISLGFSVLCSPYFHFLLNDTTSIIYTCPPSCPRHPSSAGFEVVRIAVTGG